MPIATLERKIPEATGAAFQTYGPPPVTGVSARGGEHKSTRMIHFKIEIRRGRGKPTIDCAQTRWR
jgi:hypothetical protein